MYHARGRVVIVWSMKTGRATRQRTNGLQMVVAKSKIGGPTGIKGFCYLCTRMWNSVETAGSMCRLSSEPRGDSIVALAIFVFFTQYSVTCCQRSVADSIRCRAVSAGSSGESEVCSGRRSSGCKWKKQRSASQPHGFDRSSRGFGFKQPHFSSFTYSTSNTKRAKHSTW